MLSVVVSFLLLAAITAIKYEYIQEQNATNDKKTVKYVFSNSAWKGCGVQTMRRMKRYYRPLMIIKYDMVNRIVEFNGSTL